MKKDKPRKPAYAEGQFPGDLGLTEQAQMAVPSEITLPDVTTRTDGMA
jgi:hypothetical protein